MKYAFGLLVILAIPEILVGCVSPGPNVAPVSLSAQAASDDAPVTGAKAVKAAEADPLHPLVSIETSMGTITVRLDAERAPETTLNFVQYAEKNFYDGTLFHRAIRDSRIQGGGYMAGMVRKEVTDPVAVPDFRMNSLSNRRGTIAMLRERGLGIHATAEFYINVADNTFLDTLPKKQLASVFGEVVDGLEVARRISEVPVSAHSNYAAGSLPTIPVEPVVIRSVRLIGAFDADAAQRIVKEANRSPEEFLSDRIAEIERDAGAKLALADSGLRYVDLSVGRGRAPTNDDMIQINYRGTFLDGTEFESTYLSKPKMVQVGRLIKGLQEAVRGMQEGGWRTIIIPPELAYGADGIPGKIPPDATLVFELELLTVLPPP